MKRVFLFVARSRFVVARSHDRATIAHSKKRRPSVGPRGTVGRPCHNRGFLCGYLASCLHPGSLEYVDLVTSHLSGLPTLMLWYGVCAGLHPQSSVLSEFGGLGRRLLRDVLRREHILDRPDCDLAFDELQVLL